jgi:hypothetical protein
MYNFRYGRIGCKTADCERRRDKGVSGKLIAAFFRAPKLLKCGLFVGNAHFLDHACIFGELIARHDPQLVRRAAAHGKPQLFQFAPDFRVPDRPQDFGVQPGDDLSWCAGGCEDRKPAPISPDAPGWFRITNCWPMLSAIFCVTIRAATSTALAAASGTIILIGRSG